jgi:polyisoprenoid-binding protein YceI
MPEGSSTIHMKNCILFLMMTWQLVAADPPGQIQYHLSGGYTVTIHGTMSIHDWVETIGEVTGDMVADPHAAGGADVRSIRIVMGVRSIRSDMGTVMDNKTYKALKAVADPQITFLLDAPVILLQLRRGEKPIALAGHLTLAGVTRPVVLLVDYFEVTSNSMRFEGRQVIKMTDFGVKPPSALFGTLRAGPDITIYFKTVFTILPK